MPTRRQFLGETATAAGVAGLLASIRKAAAIAPEKGSTFADAEHVVILMQENRSFDHTFGTLRGVRGFGDPRAVRLADGNPVWVQANAKGQRYVPFHLDMSETNTTWMGSLPHSWADQVDAANGGKHDGWLAAKKSGNPKYAGMPLTLGYHTREDLPFYYALADAFTVCDQYFCSTLTGTTPNRLHLWTGTIRATPASPALVRNEECDYGRWASWTTFPERLEDRGISWKVYQNELSIPTGFKEDEDAWLANFSDNPLEWFEQFGVRYADRYHKYLDKRIAALPAEIVASKAELEKLSGAAAEKQRENVDRLTATLEEYRKVRTEFSAEAFAKLPPRNRGLHAKAFDTNAGDPNFRALTTRKYRDGGAERTMTVPKGDVLFQFRKDVAGGRLPAVSWLVPPERYSDHPSSPWYGQWYLAEVFAILTKNPEVWKKTIFILTYDENDGYFDHVPPFQAPHPKKPESGIASRGIDTGPEHVELDDDRRRVKSGARGNAIGLGFRVPTVIASPWTRGGNVNSQVFDHTSVLQFLERWVTLKTGKELEETNITAWRRAVCGDLTSAFRPAVEANPGLAETVAHDEFHNRIHRAQYRKPPANFHALTAGELEAVRADAAQSLLPQQEPGVRPSCPLPYELACDAGLTATRDRIAVQLRAGNTLFEDRAAGAAFILYAFTAKGRVVRNYTVAAGAAVEDSVSLDVFADNIYRINVHGPNGFFRSFGGTAADPELELRLVPTRAEDAGTLLTTGGVTLEAVSREPMLRRTLTIRDLSYGHAVLKTVVAAGKSASLPVASPDGRGWYDLAVTVAEAPKFERHYAGRIETGRWSTSDPVIGRVRDGSKRYY